MGIRLDFLIRVSGPGAVGRMVGGRSAHEEPLASRSSFPLKKIPGPKGSQGEGLGLGFRV